MVTSICASGAVSLTLIHVASYLNSFEVFASLRNLRASIAAVMSGGRPSDSEPEDLVPMPSLIEQPPPRRCHGAACRSPQ